MYRYLAFGAFSNEEEITDYFNDVLHPDPTFFLYAIKDRTKVASNSDPHLAPGDLTAETFAGVMAFMTASVVNASAEIGCILIFPQFQRTHVLTNAAGLLLAYCLDPPEQGGLGLRRVQWQANTENLPSINAAKRLGFKMEGVLRWWRVLPPQKKGLVPAEKDRGDGRGPGRDEAMLSICFDDWENGVKGSLAKLMVLRK